MTQILVSDDLAHRIAVSAAARGCDNNELACMLIEQSLSEQEHLGSSALTPEVEKCLLEGIAQAERGEVVPGEKVMTWFDGLLRELEAR